MSDIDPGENSPVQSERSTKWIYELLPQSCLWPPSFMG
jgi:hypothetical protein